MVDNDILERRQSQRMRGLYDRQGQRSLTNDEWAELDRRVAAYGHRLQARRMRELAQRRGVSVEQVERDTAAALADALDWRQEMASDPACLGMTVSKVSLDDATAISQPEGAKDGCDSRHDN